jgi:hypothetical protein
MWLEGRDEWAASGAAGLEDGNGLRQRAPFTRDQALDEITWCLDVPVVRPHQYQIPGKR